MTIMKYLGNTMLSAALSAVFQFATAGSASAEVKPLAEPWLRPGETLVCFGDSITAFAFEQRRARMDPAALLLTRDGIHLSPRGSELAAETMLESWKMK